MRGVSVIFQHFSLFEALTVRDNIALCLPVHLRRNLDALLAKVSDSYGLPLDPKRLVGNLSAGERQRVEVVRSLLQEPRLLIMDEPTSVLTPQAVQKLFATLRRLMEARMAKQGRREYVQVLRLLESFDLVDLHGAVKQALQLGAISFDAVKHLLLCRVERRPPRLDLSIYPYLPRATVETTSAKAYMRLLSSDAGEAA